MALLLRTAWALHDVNNVEALCAAVLARVLDKKGAYLEPGRRREALGYLIGEVGIAEARWDSARTASFQLYVTWQLEHRMDDWYRQTLGDSRSRRPKEVSLSALEAEDHPAAGAGEHEVVLSRLSFR